MVDLREITDLVSARVARLLTIAQAALPPEQFRAFRKSVLDEFGWRGLARELMELLRRQ